MKVILLVILIGGAVELVAKNQPLPPYAKVLQPSEIMEVPVREGFQTLLMFPEEVRLMGGERLTAGDKLGALYFNQSPNDKRLITVKALTSQTTDLNVVMGEHGYAFQFVPSQSPASLVRFQISNRPEAVSLTREEVERRSRPVNQEERDFLVKLAREEGFLESRLPDAYVSARSRVCNYLSNAGGLNVRVSKVMRFSERDVTILLGSISNHTKERVQIHPEKARVRIGPRAVFELKHLDIRGTLLLPGKQSEFSATLIGGVSGFPNVVDIENDFQLFFTN
jgi:hypothetical protein